MALLCLFFSLNSCEKEKENNLPPPIPNQVSSDFASSIDSWTIGGEISGMEILASHQDQGGNPGACIKGDDNFSGSAWTFSAPIKYLGNKLEYYGGVFSFDFYVNKKDNNQTQVYVVFEGNDERLVYVIESPPALEWTNYLVYLSQNPNWKIESKDGLPATRDQIELVLQNIESINIQGEYRTGKDEGFLDNVLMVKEPN